MTDIQELAELIMLLIEEVQDTNKKSMYIDKFNSIMDK